MPRAKKDCGFDPILPFPCELGWSLVRLISLRKPRSKGELAGPDRREKMPAQRLQDLLPKKVPGCAIWEGTEVPNWKTKQNQTKTQHGKKWSALLNSESALGCSFYVVSSGVLWPERMDNCLEFSNTKATIYWMLLYSLGTVQNTLQRLLCSVLTQLTQYLVWVLFYRWGNGGPMGLSGSDSILELSESTALQHQW